MFVKVPLTERERVRSANGQTLDSIHLNADHIVRVTVNSRTESVLTHWTATLLDVTGTKTIAYLGSGLSEQDVEEKISPFLQGSTAVGATFEG